MANSWGMYLDSNVIVKKPDPKIDLPLQSWVVMLWELTGGVCLTKLIAEGLMPIGQVEEFVLIFLQ